MNGGDPFADDAAEIAAFVFPDDESQWRLLAKAMTEVASYLRRHWSTIESLASRLGGGETIAPESMPTLEWKAPKRRARPKAH